MLTETSTSEKPTILVVDDNPDSLSLISLVLKEDYKVKAATGGEQALRIAHATPSPDLILLDIVMPEMDGYKTCRLLKEDAGTRDIPIIFLTSLVDKDDETLGFELGAVDYINKPVRPAIVQVRIRNHLQLKKLHDNLAELVEQRTRELKRAYGRLQILEAGSRNYLSCISHELRTPAQGVLGIGQLAIDAIPDEKLRSDYSHHFATSRDRLLSAIDGALQLAELQDGRMRISSIPVEITEIIVRVADSLKELFLTKNISFVFSPPKMISILGNEALLLQSFTTLLKAAEKMAAPGTAITVASADQGARLNLRIAFESQPVPDKLLKTVFNTLSLERASSNVESLGLALPLAAEVVRAMGGEIEMKKTESGVKIGLTFLKERT